MNELQKHKVPFTQIPNELINDHSLSPRSKVVYMFMAEKPDGWEFSANRIAPNIGMGYKTVVASLRELKQAGWLKFQKLGNGKSLYTLCLSPKCKIDTLENIQSVEMTPCKNATVAKTGSISNTIHKSNTIETSNTIKNEESKDSSQKEPKDHFDKCRLLLFSEISESDIAKFSDDQKLYFKTADAFYEVFKANLEEKDVPLTNLKKARLKAWVDPVRLMYERDGLKREHFVRLYRFLQKDDFWKTNVQSTTTLRKQFNKLLMKSSEDERQTTRGGRARAANDAPTYSAEFINGILEGLNANQGA